jgi:hypothetical protein
MRLHGFWLAAAAMLGGCGSGGGGGEPGAEATAAGGAGDRMEQAALAQGVIPDPDGGTLVGSWARDTDRLCVVDAPAGSPHPVPAGEQRIGIVTDFGDGQGCTASGSVLRRGAQLRVTLERCRFVAKLEAGHIVFPGELSSACNRFCRGRASLTGLDVEQQSESASEASMLRSRSGRSVCT